MSRARRSPARRVLPQPVTGSPPSPVVPRPQRWRLDNGLQVVAVPWRTLPQVAARLIVPAGAVGDPAGLEGASSLIGDLLAEGTAELTGDQLNRRLDLLGASFGAQVGHDFAELDLFLLAETLTEGLELLAAMATRPVFPEREVERARAETLDALEARLDEPANVADDHLARGIFGAAHPYGRLPMGTAEGVLAVTRADLSRLHQARFRPGGAVLVVAGDFDLDRLVDQVNVAFGGWSGSGDSLAVPEALRGPMGERVQHLPWPDAEQGEIRLGGVGLRRADEDWIPAAVANYILGGSTITSRLGANLREDKGWTYGIRSGFSAGLQPGGWIVETAVDGDAVEAALGEITDELDRFTSKPVTEEELQRARDALILSLPRAFETPGRIVARLGTLEAFGLPEDYWQTFPERVSRVTQQDVLRVAQRHFSPEQLVQVVVGYPGATSDPNR